MGAFYMVRALIDLTKKAHGIGEANTTQKIGRSSYGEQ